MLNSFSEFWKIMVESNTFNFIIFVGIFVWIFKKIDIKSAVAKLQTGIIDTINKAKSTKDEALEKLHGAENSAKNIPAEIEKILNDAKNNADTIAKNILDDAKNQIVKIEQNTKKLIEADERAVMSGLVNETSKAAVRLAQAKLVEALDKDKKLHDSFIDNSLKELDRLEF